MERERIALWEEGSIPFYEAAYHCGENEGTCTLTPYLIEDGREHAAVLVFPGGGYTHRSEKESVPVAEYINSLGLHAFIVNYRVIPYPPYLGCVDGKRAVRFMRAHAKEYHIRQDKIGVIGFSAGAGNACMVAELYDREDYLPADEIDKLLAKPDFCILCYGSLSLKPEYMTEKDIAVFRELIPEEKEQEKFVQTYSCDALVRENMPPTFVWHAMDDERVNVGVCIDFAKRMAAMKNDMECHLFPNGGHGQSVTGSAQTEGLCQWLGLLENWLKRKGVLE